MVVVVVVEIFRRSAGRRAGSHNGGGRGIRSRAADGAATGISLRIPFRGASAERALRGISSASHLPAKLCEGLGPLRGHSDFALKAESGDS